MKKHELKERNESRFERESGIINEKMAEIRKALNSLKDVFDPMEYEWACHTFWSSMAVHDRHSLIQAIVAFYDEYVELRKGSSPSLEDVDRLIDRWFGEDGPRASYEVKDGPEKLQEYALSAMEDLVKRARHLGVTESDSDQTETKAEEKKNGEG